MCKTEGSTHNTITKPIYHMPSTISLHPHPSRCLHIQPLAYRHVTSCLASGWRWGLAYSAISTPTSGGESTGSRDWTCVCYSCVKVASDLLMMRSQDIVNCSVNGSHLRGSVYSAPYVALPTILAGKHWMHSFHWPSEISEIPFRAPHSWHDGYGWCDICLQYSGS